MTAAPLNLLLRQNGYQQILPIPRAMSSTDRYQPALPRVLLNLLLFAGCWFVCVLSGAKGLPWLGIVAAAVVIWVHLRAAPYPRREGLVIAAAVVLGMLWDGQISGHGWVAYAGGTPMRWLPPLWILATWAAFATLLNVSLRWLRGRYGVAMALGGLSAPVAYAVGAGLGAASFPDKLVALVVVAVGWAVSLPVLMALAARWDGFATNDGTPPPAAQPDQSEAAERV